MESLSELLSTDVVAGWTVQRLGIAALLLCAVGVAFKIAFGWRRQEGPHIRDAACTCGWRGRASRHAPVCPRCGKLAVLR